MALASPSAFAVPVRPGEHACCHFTHVGDRERLTVAFVREGLRRGDKVVYFFDGEEAGALRGAPLQPALASGQLELRRAQDAYIPDGRFDGGRMLGLLYGEQDRACAGGYSGLSVVGEIPGALGELPGGEHLGAYEARLASDARSCSILCQYDHGRFDPGLLSDVIREHDVESPPELAAIGRDGALAAARDRGGAVRLAGELDFGSAQTVWEVLDEHFGGPLRLDLADLSFVDVAGMRALRPRDGQRLTIAPASPAVRELLALLAWDTDPAIELVDTPSSS